MTRYVPQWLQAGSYAGSQDRRLIGALWPTPATSGCAVTPAGTGMDVHVDAGQVAVPTPNNTGTVLCTSDAIETLTLDPAPPSGTDRVDKIVCRPRSTDLDGTSTQEDFIFDVVKGTEAPSGAAPWPATPAGTVALAVVLVAGGAASIAASGVFDQRPFNLAVGGAASGRPPTTSTSLVYYYDDTGQYWIAKASVDSGKWHRAEEYKSQNNISAQWNIPAYNTMIPWDMTAFWDPWGMWKGWEVWPEIPGPYRFEGQIAWGSGAAGQWCNFGPELNAATGMMWTANTVASGPGGHVVQCSGRTGTLNVGDKLGWNAGCLTASLSFGAGDFNHIWVGWDGPPNS